MLVRGIRDASRLYHLANNGADSDSESDEDADEKNKDATIKIPKVPVVLSENIYYAKIKTLKLKFSRVTCQN